MLSLLTNVTSQTSQANLNKSSQRLSNNLSKLSSGLRVRSAADDAAGLAISETFKAKIRGLDQARRNANDGISLIQTADGALSEMGGMLNRMRELAVQSATGTLNDEQRGHLDGEFQQLSEEIDRIVDTAEFNGVNLLDGSANGSTGEFSFQVGTASAAENQISVTIASTDTTELGLDSSDITDVANSKLALDALDSAINTISSTRATLGAKQNRLSVTVSNLSTYSSNLSASNSRIVDVDVAHETAQMTRNNILVQAGASMLAQANQSPQIALSLLR